jgi:hypothetical protein
MVVGGLPQPTATHHADVADFALLVREVHPSLDSSLFSSSSCLIIIIGHNYFHHYRYAIAPPTNFSS